MRGDGVDRASKLCSFDGVAALEGPDVTEVSPSSVGIAALDGSDGLLCVDHGQWIAGQRDRLAYSFADLVDSFGPRTKRGVIVCFLSVLEMARLRLIKLRQDPDTLTISVLPIHANLRDDEDDVTLMAQLESVDEFEGDAPTTEST